MNRIPLLFICLFPVLVLTAQSNGHKCGFDLIHQNLMKDQPQSVTEIEDWNKRIQELSKTVQSRSSAVLQVPVVLHVIHGGEDIGVGRNLSDAQLQSQIDILNQDFRRLNADANNTPADFSSVAADTEIEFCLTQIDENGDPTTGINRYRYNNFSNINYIERTIKPQTGWDPERFMNIWVLQMPDQSILGYSYLPTAQIVGSSIDGVVVDYKKFGYYDNQNKGRTCTHEVGHYLGLKHVWGDNQNDGTPIGCNSDDGIADTPNSRGPYYFCPAGSRLTCGSLDMFMNYMDYTDDNCMNMFTNGQKNTMKNVLEGIRSELITNTATLCNPFITCKDISSNSLNIDFENNQVNAEWKIEDANNDGFSWLITTNQDDNWGPNEGNAYVVYFWNDDQVTSGDDYLFSPCFEAKANHRYRLAFSVACAEDTDGVVYPEKLEVGLSENQSATDFVRIDNGLFDPIDNPYPDYDDKNIVFDVAQDGTYSIGFHVFSQPDMYALQLDGIQIIDEGIISSVTTVEEKVILDVYPNPADEILTVDLDIPFEMDNLELHVYDVAGRIVLWNTVNGTQKQQIKLNVGALNPGMYFVSLNNGNHIKTKKILVQ